MEVRVPWVFSQLCLTLCHPMDCSPLGSSVHGSLQARLLEWVAISSSRGSSRPRDWNCVSYVSCISRQILYHWATWEARALYQREIYCNVVKPSSQTNIHVTPEIHMYALHIYVCAYVHLQTLCAYITCVYITCIYVFTYIHRLVKGHGKADNYSLKRWI